MLPDALELADKEKALCSEYCAAQWDMREAAAVKANFDHPLGPTDERKEQER